METKMLNAALTSPFAMLLDLDGVVAEMERSERLQRLSRRVYHPLDKPLIPTAKGQAGELIDQIDEDDL
jgi:hypothetical protein